MCGCERPGPGNDRACYLAMWQKDHACGCRCHLKGVNVGGIIISAQTWDWLMAEDPEMAKALIEPDVPSRAWLEGLA